MLAARTHSVVAAASFQDAAACRAGTYHPVQPPAAAGTFAAAAVEPSSSAIYIIDR